MIMKPNSSNKRNCTKCFAVYVVNGDPSGYWCVGGSTPNPAYKTEGLCEFCKPFVRCYGTPGKDDDKFMRYTLGRYGDIEHACIAFGVELAAYLANEEEECKKFYKKMYKFCLGDLA